MTKPFKPTKFFSSNPSKAKKSAQVFHLYRIQAQLQIKQAFGTEPKILPSQILLMDLADHYVRLFTTQFLSPHQSISVKFENPRPLFVHGQVVSCAHFNLNEKILKPAPMPYRVEIQFTFASEKEKEAVKAFAKELDARYTRLGSD